MDTTNVSVSAGVGPIGSYRIVRCRRKSIAVMVHADNRVEIRAPYRTSRTAIHDCFLRYRFWVEKVIARNARYRSPYEPKRFRSGERFSYLGTAYELFVEPGRSTEVRLIPPYLRVRCRSALSAERIERALRGWYGDQAERCLCERARHFAALMETPVPFLMIKNLRRSWGICSSRGTVSFNWRLMMAPLPVIDYVVVHELAHQGQYDHSPAFWRKVAQVIPDFRQRKRWLWEHENELKF